MFDWLGTYTEASTTVLADHSINIHFAFNKPASVSEIKACEAALEQNCQPPTKNFY